MHCDQHVRKMILEYTQMEITCRVLRGELPDDTPYHTPRMRNHPCAVYVRECWHGFNYVRSLRDHLIDEFYYRFREPDLFGTFVEHATDLFIKSIPPPPDKLFPHRRRPRPVPLAVGSSPKYEDPVRTYREFYISDKARFATWTRRTAPAWWVGDTHG